MSRRENWSGQGAFLLAAIGSAIGLGNIWRFPGVAYANGSGAFIVPYLIALLCVGIPVLFLDYAIGHKFKGSPPLALRRLTPKGEFLGWLQALVCFVILSYYAVIIAWALKYAIYSVKESWGEDTKTFFLQDYLQLTKATGEYSFTPVWGVAIPLILVWVFVLIILGRGLTKGVELANKIFLPLLVVLFAALVVRSIFLPGALDGLNTFFTPDWEKLQEPKVWLAAFAQIFYSLSVAFGIMLTYASYLKPKSNLTGTGLVAGFANSSFEILAGIGVFSALGFMAHQQHTTVGELEGLTGPILSFVTFPKIISMMPGGPLFGVLFFTSLVLAGITSLLSLLQVVSGGLQDKFGFSPSKASLILGVPAAVISVGLFATQTGLNALDVVDNFINSIGVVLCAVLMCVLAAVAYPRLKGLREHLNDVSSVRVPAFWDVLVGIIVPLVLAFMLVTSIIDIFKSGYGDYSTSYITVMGWGAVILALGVALVLTLLPWRRDPSDESASVANEVNQ